MPCKDRRAQKPVVPRVLKGGPSKLRGVIWHKSNGKWEARIYETGKQRFLGYYTSEVAAAKAYDARAVQLHGSAAKVNFPEDHEETRNNPPAVKTSCLAPASASTKESPERQKRRSPRGSSWNSTTTRLMKRKEENHDEDYVLPVRGSSNQIGLLYSLRPPSSRRKATLDACTSDIESDSESCNSDFEDEHNLEQGAVEVLATLLSSSEGSGSWRSSLMHQGCAAPGMRSLDWTAEEGAARARSPPTSSTGASPAPLQKTREWTMPPLWVHTNQDSPPPAESSCQMGQPFEVPAVTAALEINAEGDCADSLQAAPRPLQDSVDVVSRKPWTTTTSNNESCSEGEEELSNVRTTQAPHSSRFKGVSWNSVCRKWVAVIWDRQAKRARHIGTFDDAVEAAHAYDRQAMKMLDRGATLNFPEFQGRMLPDTDPMQEARHLPTYAHERSAALPAPNRQAPYGTGKITTAARAAAVSNGKSTRGSSRFRGVSWCEKGQKWRALLWDGSRQHFLGHFKSEEEGARAYDRALLLRKKKDGCLNFPLSDYTDIVGALEDSDAHTFLKPGQPNVAAPAQGPGKAAQAFQAAEEDAEIKPVKMISRPRRQPRRQQSVDTLVADETLPSVAADEEEALETEEELEAATPEFDMRNGLMRSKTTHGSSRYRGVSWSSRSAKWRAQMWLGSKVMHLGFFDDELSAARAYDHAVAAYRGPGAPANFTGTPETVLDSQKDQPNASQEQRGGSGYRGVRWHERNNKWEARIFDSGRQRQVSLGYFENEVQAAMAFDAAALQMRGPSACTNFIPNSSAGNLTTNISVDDSHICISKKREAPQHRDLFMNSAWGSKKRRNS